MIRVTPCRRMESIVLYAFLTISAIAQTAVATTCDSQSCKEVSYAYEGSVFGRRKPCEDFYSYACGGWYVRLLSHSNYEKTRQSVAPDELVARAIDVVLLNRLEPHAKKLDEAPSEALPDSELQAISLFKSCVRSAKNDDWGLKHRTLRRFFSKIGLPFIDEEANPKTSAFSVVMILACQYNITPFWTIYADDETIYLYPLPRYGGVRRDRKLEYDDDENSIYWLAHEWTEILQQFSREAWWDPQVFQEIGALFDSYHIKVSNETLLRIGRSYLTVNAQDFLSNRRWYDNTCYQKKSVTDDDKFLKRSWKKLFEEYMGSNWGYVNKNFLYYSTSAGRVNVGVDERCVEFLPYSFYPLYRMLTNENNTRIFLDFLTVFLLYEFSTIAHENQCDKPCKIDEPKLHRDCVSLVAQSLPWTAVAMSGRATHTTYTSKVVNYIFALLKAQYAEIIRRLPPLEGLELMAKIRTHYLIKNLMQIRARGFYPEALDHHDITEVLFPMSPRDLLHNLIRIKKAGMETRLAKWFANLQHRNVTDDPLSRRSMAFDRRPPEDLILPAYLLEFPHMVETLPMWTMMSSLGRIMAREMSDDFLLSLENFADYKKDSHPMQSGKKEDYSIYHKYYPRVLDCYKNLYTPLPGDTKASKEPRDEKYYREAMSEHLGLIVAYKAWKYLYSKEKTDLPSRSNFSMEQMFFISRAFSQCSLINDENIWDERWRTHPPKFYLVNRGLQNFAPFASAFNCTKDDPMMTSSSDSISVAVRIRPAKHENDVDEWVVQDQVIYAAQPECQHNVFAFDHILSQEKTNADVYEQVVQPIIASVMAGYNGTVFAYGQTSSGKTHTMMGNDQDPGVIKRAISQIFDEIHEQTHREFLIRISYLEIYNEQIRDLLNNSSSANLPIKGPDMAVAGLTEQVTTDSEQILRFMTEGDKNRQVGCTNMNERSSRSHSIFRITIESSNRNSETNKRDGVRVSQLNLVDLAGSERATQTGATGTRLREGCHINTSLSALGLVIRKLSTGEKHINFRDSKLTRILQNSLGGNSRTAIICNISPSDYETSLSTLRFGSDAKRIKNKPVINQVIAEDATLLQKRNKEIESLKALISKVETGKEQQLKEKDDTIDKLRKKIEGLQKLAIGGELPASVSDRNVASMPARRTDTRRRETWCPGQIAAAATPAKASAIVEMTHVQDDSFIAKYGTYTDPSFSFTPARPRKRKSAEAFSGNEAGTSSEPGPNSKSDNPVSTLSDELEEAQREIASLKEELEFLRNEKQVYCGGACTPAAKRARVEQPTCATTPVPTLSLIREEESDMEDDSPFGMKLKIMATPSEKIQCMKLENRMLKRSLMAASACSTPALSEDTVMTLCNKSVPTSFETKPSTRDAACQCEEWEQPQEKSGVPFVIAQTSNLIELDAAESPATGTPLRTLHKPWNDSTPLIDFCRPRAARRSVLTPAAGSEASWLDLETTPKNLPPNVRDVEIQVAFAEEIPRVSKEDAETSTELNVRDVEIQVASAEGIPRVSKEDAETSTELNVRDVEIQVASAEEIPRVSKKDAETWTEPATDSEAPERSISGPQSEDASTQTVDGKGTPPRSAINRFSIVTRCMESPGSVCATDGVRGLDAILADTSKPRAKKVITRDVGVMARIEELWVIKMKLEQEKTAREEAEAKLDEVWKERGKLLNTNDRYLDYFTAHGIDPREILSGQSAPGEKLIARNGGAKIEDSETLRKKYDTLKEFCFRHADIKERMLSDGVFVRQTPLNRSSVNDDAVKTIASKESTAEAENVKPPTGEGETSGEPRTKPNERPLAELQDMQQFRGAKYLAEADPGECRPS